MKPSVNKKAVQQLQEFLKKNNAVHIPKPDHKDNRGNGAKPSANK